MSFDLPHGSRILCVDCDHEWGEHWPNRETPTVFDCARCERGRTCRGKYRVELAKV